MITVEILTNFFKFVNLHDLAMDETFVLWVQFILTCNLIIDIQTNILRYCSMALLVTFIDLQLVLTECKFFCLAVCLIGCHQKKI